MLPREAFTEPSVQTLVAQKLRAYVPFLVPFGKLAKRLLKVRARVGRPRGLGSRSLEPSPVLDPFPSFRELESVLPRSNPSLFGRVVSVRSLPSFGTRRVVDQLSSRACPAASRLVRRPSRGARRRRSPHPRSSGWAVFHKEKRFACSRARAWFALVRFGRAARGSRPCTTGRDDTSRNKSY